MKDRNLFSSLGGAGRKEIRPTKKINNSHVIWFEESNSWAQFEEPVWYIFRQINSIAHLDNLSQKFSRRYGLNFDESLAFVTEISIEIQKLAASSFKPPVFYSSSQFESPSHFFSTRNYKLNQKVLEISYKSRALEYAIHQSFAHLEVKIGAKPDFRLETFSTGTASILKIEQKAWAEGDVNLLKRRLFIEISSILYGKTDNDWLSFVHGSAISNSKESIILSTACGSGKSTMAALLCKEGLHFVTDDYVPIDVRTCKVYPFPAALSVKDGAYPVILPYYDQLKTAQVFHFKGTNKTVRYLSFPSGKNFYKPLPVRNLVFIKYNPSIEFSFRKVPTLEAIPRFNEEAWVSYNPAHARKFLKWFPSLNCFELEYSDNAQAIQAIMGLFRPK